MRSEEATEVLDDDVRVVVGADEPVGVVAMTVVDVEEGGARLAPQAVAIFLQLEDERNTGFEPFALICVLRSSIVGQRLISASGTGNTSYITNIHRTHE